jgi:hypothetical protein
MFHVKHEGETHVYESLGMPGYWSSRWLFFCYAHGAFCH